MKEKKYRKYFLTCLNKYRIAGLFTIEEKSFGYLGDLLNRILDETVKEKDLESAKFCMILSQTFYKASSDPNNPRVFLQYAIEGHEIWKKTEFWEGIIKFSIHEEIHNRRSYTPNDQESPDDKQMRIQSIAFGQLLSFTFNMLSFEIPKERVREVIHSFCKSFKIPEELALQILKSVDEYTSTIDQQVKMDIIDDNLSVISSDINDKTIVKYKVNIQDANFLKNIIDNQKENTSTNIHNSNLLIEKEVEIGGINMNMNNQLQINTPQANYGNNTGSVINSPTKNNNN